MFSRVLYYNVGLCAKSVHCICNDTISNGKPLHNCVLIADMHQSSLGASDALPGKQDDGANAMGHARYSAANKETLPNVPSGLLIGGLSRPEHIHA